MATGYTQFGTVSNSEQKLFVTRYLPNGTPDASFGSNGVLFEQFSDVSQQSTAFCINVSPNDKFYVGGSADFDNWFITGFNADGTLDPTFGQNGKLETKFADKRGNIIGLVRQIDGKLVGIGSATTDNDNSEFALVRYNENGDLDTTFANGGIQINPVFNGVGSDFGACGAVQPDGKIVVLGTARHQNLMDIALARYLTSLNVGVIDFSTPIGSALVYPNPIAETATLQYSLTRAETVFIQLFDKQGKLISLLQSPQLQEAGDHSVQISLPADLPTGSYVLSIQSATGRVAIQVVR